MVTSKFVCAVCKTKKSPVSFPSSDAKVCTACEAELKKAPEAADELFPAPKAVKTPSLRIKSLPVEPEAPPGGSDAPDAPPVASSGDVFVPNEVEIDYRSPSAQEAAARTLAGRRLIHFIKRFRPKYDAGWVHEDICRRLERFVKDIEDGKEPRLLLAMPVRHGKSEIASRHFAPWVLGKHPDWEIIAASGAQSLAMSFSRYIRDLVRDPSYQAIFGHMKLDPSSQSVENWNTTYGGGYLAAGIGTMITGRGAHCVVPYCGIDTASGIIPLVDIKVGDLVYGYDHETNRIVETEVRAISVSVRKTKLVAIKNGPVVTEDHKIYNPATLRYQVAGLSNGMPGLWRTEGSTRRDVLGVLLREQDLDEHHAQMRLLRERISSRSSRASEVAGPRRLSSASVLREGVLHAVQAGKSTLVQYRKRFVSAVRRTCGWEQPSEVLQSQLLHPVPHPSEGFAGVRCGVPGTEGSGVGAGQDMRYVRRQEGTDGDTPRRSRLREQHTAESRPPVRPVSPKISHAVGTSAASFAELFQDEDFVVDIQTDTQNFFAAGCLLHNCLLLDDPVKDAEAADSRVIRDATWEWYMSTAVTRLAPGGGVLGIMTFWHDDDWAGRIQQVMATGDGDKFEIVKYPAINEQGDEYILADDSIVQLPAGSTVPDAARMTRPKNSALHPARYTLEALLRRKANYAALGQQRWWNALYQQNPSAEEGAYFRKDWFQGYGTAPRRTDCTVYQAWDFAITEKAQSDWTVGTTIAQDSNDNLYVLDVRRFRMGDGDELMKVVVSYAMEFQPDLLGFEDGQIWKALSSTFTKTCQEHSYYPSYEVLQPLTDKMVRAQPLRGRMQARKVFFDKTAHWYNDLLQEFLRFPTGKNDDQVDSAAWSVRLTLSKSAPKPPAPPPLKSWKDKLGALMAGSDASHMSS